MTAYPHVTIDLVHRMLSVRLNDRKIAWTDQLDDAHLVDVDAEGGAVGIDILTLDDFKIDEMATQFSFTEQVPAIKAAIQDVMKPTVTTGSVTAGPFGPPLIVEGTRVSGLSADAETEHRAMPPVVPPIFTS